LYQQWFAAWATALEFRNAADLRELFRRVKALRSAKLDRIELRACNIGSDATSMTRVRRFFGCAKITAPTVHTIYGVVAVGAMGGRAPTARLACSYASGQSAPTRRFPRRSLVGRVDVQTSTRGFVHFTDAMIALRHVPARPHSPIFQLPPIELFGGFRFVLRIVHTGGIDFGSAAWAAGSAKSPAPDPDIIKHFCAGAFKTDTLFHDLNLLHAGLWTPGEAKPFVFPLEPEYLAHIAQSPAPPPKKP
jgi:hypothetical protein